MGHSAVSASKDRFGNKEPKRINVNFASFTSVILAIHQDFENALAGLSLTTFAKHQQELKSILDEPAPVDFKAVVDNLNKEKQETSSKNATLQSENENLKSSNFIWKVYAGVMTIMVAIFAFIKLVNTPTFRKIISILLKGLSI